MGEVPMVKPAGVRIEFEYYIKAIVEVAFNFGYHPMTYRDATLLFAAHTQREQHLELLLKFAVNRM